MTDCPFCKIASGDIPADIVDQDNDIVVFRDINPQAPTHILIIPIKHIDSIASVQNDQAELIGNLFCKAREVAAAEFLDHGGYRLVINHGPEAGQSVFHLHIHLIGGRALTWPPG